MDDALALMESSEVVLDEGPHGESTEIELDESLVDDGSAPLAESMVGASPPEPDATSETERDVAGRRGGRVLDGRSPRRVREAVADAAESFDDAPSLEVDIDDDGDEDEVDDEAPEAHEPETSDSADLAPSEPEPSEPPAAAAPSLGVVVQRVVSVVSSPGWSPSPPPPEEEPEVAVDIDDEPELRIAEPDAGEMEELDVDLEDSEHGEALEESSEGKAEARDSAPELPTEEAEELLEEAEVAEPDEETRAETHLSKPPPPPAKTKDAAPPPPPEAPPEAPKASAQKAAPPRRRKGRRQWWEDLFNDDYLRTVPIPHPRIIERQCDFIEQRLGLAKGATILDVGCGLGLHAVELTRRGYLVVGLDLSLPMLSRAADEAQDHGFKINFLHADMREMNFDGAFDAVLCYGTTFGYFDDETNKQVVERLFRALKPRGLLLLDVVNRDYVIRNQPNLVWFEGDACVVMEESQMNYITSRLEVKRTVILDDGRQRDSVYSLRSYSLHELGQILHHQGFRVVEVTGWEAHPGVFFGGDSPKLDHPHRASSGRAAFAARPRRGVERQ